MNIYYEIERLIHFSLVKELIEKEDEIFTRNNIYSMFNLAGEYNNIVIKENPNTVTEILENMTVYAIQNKMINDTNTERDLFITKIMGIVTPKPSYVINKFKTLYNIDKKQGTEYFYNLSRDCNYVMVDRVNKNIEWDKETKYGKYKITINVSKPEKTPEEIKKAKLIKGTGYPECLLCKENVGFQGSLSHPARQNLRTIPIKLNEELWQMQYSPYVYYNEHCIIFKEEHSPMKISRDTFIRLLDFVEILPHYFIGSNADLPIVGGSILSHDHFQGGNYELPMAKAKSKIKFISKDYENVTLSILDWGMSVIRISGTNKKSIVDIANNIYEKWKLYSVENIDIISHTNEIEHNTVNPIARVNKKGELELDIVLRNNRTSKEYPEGIFHTHKEHHHIKQENIGLIEVMGLAILPKRLIKEFEEIKKYLSGTIEEEFDKESVHYEWVQYLLKKYGINNDEKKLKKIFEEEIGEKFSKCLLDCGVFKDNEVGTVEFIKFVNHIGFVKK